ncbi:M4 family metallopeptidase [Peribacillus deserti]
MYLTPTSNFRDARKVIIQSAVDHYGAGIGEAKATVSVFDQAGILQ